MFATRDGVLLGLMGARRLIERSNSALWWCTFAPLCALYLITVRTPTTIANFDPAAVSPSAWALAHQFTPRLSSGMWPALNQWFVQLGHGDVVSNRSPGLILIAAPFYALSPSSGPQDQYPSALAAALCTAAAMATLALVVRRIAPAQTALTVAIVAGTATTTWTVSGTSLWPHGPDQLLLALALLSLERQRHVRAGLSFAAAAVVRQPMVIVAAAMGVAQSIRQRSIRPLASIGLITSVGLLGSLLYSWHFWHGGLGAQYHDEGENVIGTFFSSSLASWESFGVNIFGTVAAVGHGVLFTSPFLIALAPGLKRAWQQAPSWIRSATLAGLLYLLVQLKSNRFSGGEGFWGYRYPLETLTLAAPLLVLAWRAWVAPVAARRAAFVALVVLSITEEAIGATCYAEPDYFNHVAGLTPHLAWLPANMAGVLIGSRALPAAAILTTGLCIAAAAYHVIAQPRPSLTSSRSYVLHVPRADRLLQAAYIDD